MPYYTGLYGAGELSKREKAYELRLVSLLRGGRRRSWRGNSVVNFELSFGVVPMPSILVVFSGLGPLPV
jgi:hypothetical protein